MALYTERSFGDISSDWEDMQRQELERQQREAAARYNAAQNQVQQAQAKPTGWLESVLSGIGNSISNVGKSLYDLGGTTIANWRDVLEGKNVNKEGSYTQDFKKSLYGGDSAKDRYAKSAGTSLDAAVTLSDLIPVAGGATKIGKLVGGAAGQIGQGALSGVAQNYIDNGANATLEDSLKGALIGGASAGAGKYVGGKLAGKTAGNGLVSRALNSNIGKAALTGAASGATGGALSSTLNGGDLGQTLASAAQGAGRGAAGGATMAGIMGLAGAGVDRLKNKIENPAQPKVQPEVETATKKSNMIGRALKNAGKELEAAQTDITRAERRKFGIKDAGETVNTLRKRTGFSSLDDQAEFAKNITGGDDSVMDTIQRYNLSVDADGKPITLRADQYEVAINDAVGKDWKKSVMGETYDKFRDDLISDIQNEDPITASNWLKKEAATQRGIAEAKGPTSDVAARKAKIYTEVANSIDELTYSAIPEKNVNRMFDDTIDEFYTRAQEAKAVGNKKYANAYTKLAKELENTPRTIADYRTFKKDFVKSSQLADISAGAQSGSLQAGLSKGTNVVNKLLNTALGEPLDRAMAYAGGKLSDFGDIVNGQTDAGLGKVAGGVARGVAGAMGALNNSTFSDTALGDMVSKQIARQSGLDAIRNAKAEAETQQAQQEMQAAEQAYNDISAQAPVAMQTIPAQQVNPGMGQLDTISRAMELALNAGDLESYGKLADLYQQAYKIYGVQDTTTTAKAEKLTDNQTKALTGLNQLNQLAGMNPGVGTVLSGSPLGGVVNMFGGDDYANQAQALALTLGYLQSGANVSKNEAENIGKSYIPTAFDSDAVRQQKLARARELLNNYLYGTQYYQG